MTEPLTVLDLIALLQALPPELHAAPVYLHDSEYDDCPLVSVTPSHTMIRRPTYDQVPNADGGTTSVYRCDAFDPLPMVRLDA